MRNSNAYNTSILALFMAIIIIQNVVPFLGYIPIGGLSLVIIHVTVAIGAVVLGTRDGAILGGVWGLIDWVRAFFWPTSPLAVIVMVNPFVSVLPRILVGVVAGMTFTYLVKRWRPGLAMSAAGIAGALTNTILVLGLIYVFYKAKAPQLYQVNLQHLLPYLLAVVGTNGVPEAILAGIAVPAISRPLMRFTRRSGWEHGQYLGE